MIICAFVPAPEFRCNKPKDRQMDRQTDRWTHGQMNRQTDICNGRVAFVTEKYTVGID